MKLSTLFKKQRKIIMGTVLIFLVIALVGTFVQPLKYRVQAKVLVVQEFSPEADPFTVSRLNEYLSTLLANVVQSESFFQQALSTGFNFDNNYFSGTRKQQLRKWEKTVEASAIYDTGLITISVYHPDAEQAEQLTQAIIKTLATKNSFYHSIQNVEVRIIDSPTTSRFPVRPNIALNVLVGLILGLAVGIALASKKI